MKFMGKRAAGVLLCLFLLLGVISTGGVKKVTAASENLAYNKNVTVSSTQSDQYPGSNAVDADGGTRWSSAYTDSQYIIVDLGSDYSVNKVRLAWEAAYASQYQIQISRDNMAWTTVYSDYNGQGGVKEITFTAAAARYIKLYAFKRATQYGYSLYEFEVYGADTGNTNENMAYHKAVTVSSSESSAYPGTNAVDADGTTRWSSAYSDQQYIIVDLGKDETVGRVKLAWEAAYAKEFQIQVSADNITYKTVYSDYNGNGGSQEITFTPVTARYVKLYAFKRATAYGYSLYEFEIYRGQGSSGGSPEIAAAKEKVMNYIKSISGSKTLIGIHNREPNSDPDVQTERAYGITGQYPALWSGDFLFSSDDVAHRWTMIEECRRQWDNGSLVQLMLHVVPPTQNEPGSWDGGVVSSLSDSQWNSLITGGGTLNQAWKQRLDTYAVYLQYLKDNGVVVLFRPFHEMNQGIFWWAGRTGSNGTAALFRLTRDYLENVKGLDNLIWVWDMQDLDYNWSTYNPGNNYWDIFALDIYNGDGFTAQKYNTALSVAGDKPIAIGECAVLPTASQLTAQNRWVFCMSWSELTFQNNTNSQIQNLYWAENVLVRNELPADLFR